jgi:hypothetical protein
MPTVDSHSISFLVVSLYAAFGALLVSAQFYMSGVDGLRGKSVYIILQRVLLDVVTGVAAAMVIAPDSVKLAFACGVAGPVFRRSSIAKRGLTSKRTEELRRSVQRAEEAVQSEPAKAKPVWELSKAQLDQYVERNLSQVRQIFIITVGVMAAGFTLVVWGAYRAFDGQVQIAIVTAVSGVITQAIGATFLFVYRSTIRVANDYAGTLERINAVGMAVTIVDQIPDSKIDEKTKARVDLVKQILLSSPKPFGASRRANDHE